MTNIKLTKNFSLDELLASDVAKSQKYGEQFNPPAEILANIKLLCDNILQPLREVWGKPIKITSGYRCLRLNNYVKGATGSQHILGQAADISDYAGNNTRLFLAIQAAKLPYDQLIDEYGYTWLHVSYNKAGGRRQMLRSIKGANGATIYEPV